jgi:hypothetical protein
VGSDVTTSDEQYAGEGKAEMFDILRREILAARLKVTLDRELNRPTSDSVRRLATMKLPPENWTRCEEDTSQWVHCG